MKSRKNNQFDIAKRILEAEKLDEAIKAEDKLYESMTAAERDKLPDKRFKMRESRREREMKAIVGELGSPPNGPRCLNCGLVSPLKRRSWVFLTPEQWATVEKRPVCGAMPHAACVTVARDHYHIVCRSCYVSDSRFKKHYKQDPSEPWRTCRRCNVSKPREQMMNVFTCRACYQTFRYRNPTA